MRHLRLRAIALTVVIFVAVVVVDTARKHSSAPQAGPQRELKVPSPASASAPATPLPTSPAATATPPPPVAPTLAPAPAGPCSGHPCCAPVLGNRTAFAFQIFGPPSRVRLEHLSATAHALRSHNPGATVIVLIGAQWSPDDAAALGALGPDTLLLRVPTITARSCAGAVRTSAGSTYGSAAYFAETFNRLWLWELVQFEAIMYLDFDVLVRGDLQHVLREFFAGREYRLGGSLTRNDYCGPGMSRGAKIPINGGVTLLKPEPALLRRMALFMGEGRFSCGAAGGDAADQGLVNAFFWGPRYAGDYFMCVPPEYNCRTYDLPKCVDGAIVVHWAGSLKPWSGAPVTPEEVSMAERVRGAGGDESWRRHEVLRAAWNLTLDDWRAHVVRRRADADSCWAPVLNFTPPVLDFG